MGKAYVHMINQAMIRIGGQKDLKEKKQVQYTVERKYLAKFPVEELVVRIIKSHLEQSIAKKHSAK